MASDSGDKHPKDSDDIKQHLLKIEERLDRLSLSPQLSFGSLSAHQNDEIDLREIWNILWGGKWWIVGITFLFAVGSAIVALGMPNQYKAEVVLAPAQEKNSGMGGLAAQYGGLAAMAGINLGGGKSSDVDQAMALVKSWPFLDKFVNKHSLKPLIMAVEGWDSTNNRIIYDEEIYNPETKQWLREAESNKPAEPTSHEVYQTLSKALTVEYDTKVGLISLKIEHQVPGLTSDWVRLLVADLNQHFQTRDIENAKRNIEYLREKISETSISDMQSVFYRMIEAQMKTLMLAEVSNEYLLKTVVEAKTPEKKSKPLRALICILGVLLGGAVGVGVVVIKHIYETARKQLR